MNGPGDEDSYSIGWLIIVIVLFNTLVNFLFMLYENFKALKAFYHKVLLYFRIKNTKSTLPVLPLQIELNF